MQHFFVRVNATGSVAFNLKSNIKVKNGGLVNFVWVHIKLTLDVSFLENFMNNSIEELRKIYREQYGKVIKKKRKKRNCSQEEFNIHSVSERLCNAVRYIRSVKGAYPPIEWSLEQCKEEYERLLPILEKEIKNCNYEEILIIGRMLGVLEEYRFGKSERLFEIGKVLRENLLNALSGHDDLIELLFKTQALKAKIYCK